ncbi:ATP-binding cassette domain-containing protein [Mobilitalea sibirica]|uniref:ATP-binding cassette domain-containing protein n=1 Tax=Mobilitalea sibirica TaxID=1462919 RepID=A0A8J7HCC4_9FIRM|nr:ATP-binding cassette domain-containing protein [Mobilitalea sibirica]MBH1939919.1 ATP-binding cassette domain-containing protein [Mobilitalea sibirica]
MHLEGRNIGFRYNKSDWILRNFNISLKEGEVIGLIGPSGCGKTTLGRILAGYEIPQEGKVTLDNIPLPTTGIHPVQLINQHPEKAVNPRWKMKKVLDEVKELDEDILIALGIEKEWLNRWPNELSGGELQRFCVARALSVHTKFIIADEMTTMLDAITQAQIWNSVQEIAKKRNMGILVISHEHNLLKRLCCRVIDLSI